MVCYSVARYYVTVLSKILYQSLPGKCISDYKVHPFHSDQESGNSLTGNDTSNVTLMLFRERSVVNVSFLQAIEDRYGRKNELYGSEATFDTDSDRVLLDIDKDGETTREGWHIRPCAYPPSVR